MRRTVPSRHAALAGKLDCVGRETRTALAGGRTPEKIGPDHLTILGFAAQIGAGVCYALAFWNRFALLV